MNSHVEDESQHIFIEKERFMSESESTNESGYDELIHCYVRCMIREAIEEYEEGRTGRHTNNRSEIVVLGLVEEAPVRATLNIYTLDFEATEQAVCKAFLSGRADMLLED